MFTMSAKVNFVCFGIKFWEHLSWLKIELASGVKMMLPLVVLPVSGDRLSEAQIIATLLPFLYFHTLSLADL